MSRVLRFLVVGVIAFFLDAGLLILLETVSQNVWLSATISFSIATLFNFIASYFWVNQSQKPIITVLPVFVLLSIAGLFLNNLFLTIYYEWMHLGLLFSKCVTTGIVMVFNYFTRIALLEGGQQHG